MSLAPGKYYARAIWHLNSIKAGRQALLRDIQFQSHELREVRVHYALAICLFFAISASAQSAKLLIYSATAGFRHDSIPTAIEVLKGNGSIINASFDNTEDKSQFTDENLSQYDAVVFLSTTGEVLDDAGKDALQTYFDNGGNFIGIHAASDTLDNTTFYTHELGAVFATVDILNSSHPATSMLPTEWHVQDEMYNFKSDPRTLGAVVIIAANESSYIDDGVRNYDQGTPHPLVWYQEHGAGSSNPYTSGRSFYTALGHLNETWEEDLFVSHVLGGIQWALESNTTLAFNSSALVGNAANRSITATISNTASTSTSTSSVAVSSSSSNAPASAKISFGLLLFGLVGIILRD